MRFNIIIFFNVISRTVNRSEHEWNRDQDLQGSVVTQIVLG